jgi:hypothetical protein
VVHVLPHPERPTRIQRPCRIPRPSRTRPCRIRFPAAAPAIPFPRMAFLLQPPLPARGTITRRHAERFRGVTTFCPPLPARLRARKAKPPRSCPPPRDVSQTLAHRTRRPARPLPFPTPTHGGALRAIDAESRIAASDPVKVHTHVLSVSRVHDGYFFAFRIVFDSLEQLARSLARVGGSRVPFTDSLPCLDLAPVQVWWQRFGRALDRVLGRHVLPRVSAVCLECETAGFRESRFSHRTISVLFQKFWELGVLSGARSRCPSGGHQFSAWLIATPSSSSLMK